MVSFTSSAINKSGKKFTPKAPARRVATGSSTATTAPKPSSSLDSQNAPTTSRPDTDSANPAASVTSNSDLQTNKPSIHQPQHSERPQIIESPAPSPAPTSEFKSVPPEPAAKISNQSARPKSKSGASDKPTIIPIPTSRPQYSATPSPLITRATPPELRGASNVPHADVPQTQTASGETTSRKTDSGGSDVQIQSSYSGRQTSQLVSPAPHMSSESDKPAVDSAAIDHVDVEPPQNPAPSNRSSIASEVRETPLTEPSDTTAGATRQIRKPHMPQKRRKSINTTEAIQPKKQRAKRKREPTPEESELIEIAPTIVKMSELCKDLRTGKKSKRELELRNLDLAEVERKQKAKDEARNSVSLVKQQTENGEGAADGHDATPQKSQAGPRMRIVNGEIVIDNTSLQVDRRAEAALDSGDMEDVYESRLSRKINQATYGKRTKAESWDEELTDLFYRGLRMFGTDFMMISKMFPGRSRRQIKLKFNNEERRDPERIKETLLGPREAVDIQTYSEMTNTVYDDPRVIQQELDEDKKRIEEQHAKEKLAQEELLHNPGGSSSSTNVIQSIEKPDSLNTRSRSKKTAASKNFYEGTEEILGTIDDPL